MNDGVERTVVHIADREAWDAAQEAGTYAAPSLATEGFIHCSERRQLPFVLNTFFPGSRDHLVLLVIDVDRLDAELRWDPVGDDVFPHIYGPINGDAVVATESLRST